MSSEPDATTPDAAPLGRHLLAEMHGCVGPTDDPEAVDRAMRLAVQSAGATLLHLRVHRFEPQGVTGLALLSESHLAMHSWPEHGYVAADLFTCGRHVQGERAIEVLRTAFEPERIEVRTVERGAGLGSTHEDTVWFRDTETLP